VEHLAALRAIPNLTVLRPADANETAAAWQVAVENETGPTALILSRQNLPLVTDSLPPVSRGAYVLREFGGAPDVILMASGSEVSLTLDAAERLAAEGIAVRVVSFPSWELFDAQEDAYRAEVLPPDVTARVAVEAGVAQGWRKYVGSKGAILSIETFGASAPGNVVFEQYGFTVENVLRIARTLLAA
jgi:transketolase